MAPPFLWKTPMAKQSLLEIVQEILSDMTSDPVNSINDTVEAMQVATIVKRTFLNLTTDRIWPSRKKLFRLTSSADADKPTHMRIEDDVVEVDWVKYDVREAVGDSPDYRDVPYVYPEVFLQRVMARDADDSNVRTITDYDGTKLFILDDHSPSYFTSFDDKHLVFDSFDSSVDSILQHSKTQVFGVAEPTWEMEDGFIPDMPSKFFPYLVNEAKSTSFIKLKEVFSQKDEQNSIRQKSWLSRNKNRIDGGTRYPDYGRKAPGKYGRSRRGYNNNHFTG